MKHHPRIADDVSFARTDESVGQPDASNATGTEGGTSRSRPPRPAGEWAEKAGIYAIVLVTIVGLANALGLV